MEIMMHRALFPKFAPLYKIDMNFILKVFICCLSKRAVNPVNVMSSNHNFIRKF